jgi:purine-binding chemotaxis protein CheW
MSGARHAVGGGEAGRAGRRAPRGDAAVVPLLLFRLGRRWFAMDARAIEEVALRGQVTRVPMAPSHILGVTSLRGRLVTVVSLEQMLGAEGVLPVDSSATLPRLVVVREGHYEVAVVAHGIAGLIERAGSGAPARPSGAPDFVREELAGEEGPVWVLDTRHLVAAAARLAGAEPEESGS